MAKPKLLFVTGRLAEPALREVLPRVAVEAEFAYDVVVLPITVAALMRVEWISRKLPRPHDIDRVILPGWCLGDIAVLQEEWQIPVERGPKDLQDLPEHFGRRRRPLPSLDDFSIEILAEINHAPRLSQDDLVKQAEHFRTSGADLIDLGAIPGEPWPQVGEVVRTLKSAGFRISIDSFDRSEVTTAVEQGAELVLSANSTNLAWATELPVEWVAIPDDVTQLTTLEQTAATLKQAGRSVRWDPILEPVGFGFTASLQRYFTIRNRYPDIPLMMGVGNVTELAEVDSAGVNFLLAVLCEELQIGSILTTEVINWCRSAVREFDAARRLARFSITQRRLPKHLDGRLLLLRDPKLQEQGTAGLQQLAERITDPNFRVFAERGEVHLINRDGYWHGDDPYEVFDRMIATVGTLTAEHAFYLGMELMKAHTALVVGKHYVQDEALRWGFLTTEETSAMARRHGGHHPLPAATRRESE
ncbi:dihydropteroate synthase [bacterium]|nr:dihydropteroate synthase [bacterium]